MLAVYILTSPAVPVYIQLLDGSHASYSFLLSFAFILISLSLINSFSPFIFIFLRQVVCARGVLIRLDLWGLPPSLDRSPIPIRDRFVGSIPASFLIFLGVQGCRKEPFNNYSIPPAKLQQQRCPSSLPLRASCG